MRDENISTLIGLPQPSSVYLNPHRFTSTLISLPQPSSVYLNPHRFTSTLIGFCSFFIKPLPVLCFHFTVNLVGCFA
jgi:hypothetical protein